MAAGAKAQYSGVFQTILKVAKDEGVLKLWRGVSYFPLSPSTRILAATSGSGARSRMHSHARPDTHPPHTYTRTRR